MKISEMKISEMKISKMSTNCKTLFAMRLAAGVCGLALLLAAAPLAAAEWGNLSVTFVYDGDPPQPSPVTVNKDQAVCGPHNLKDESLVVNASNGGVANIVAFLYLQRGAPQPPVHESYAESADGEVLLDNSKCRFEPRVALLRTSQTLVLGNKDPVGHNTKIDTFANPAINPLIPAGGKLDQKFSAPERLPCPVSCSIHAWMKGWLVVRDNPYFAVSDKDGRLKIENLPAGEWTFQFWQERSGYVNQVKVDGKPTEWTRGRLTLKIAPGENDLGQVKLPPAIFEK